MSKSKNNYNKMYEAAAKPEETAPVESVEPVATEPTAEKIKMEKPAKPKVKTTGVVSSCELLNVRADSKADAAIVKVIAKGSKVNINLAESTDEWYKVTTQDKIAGYCMKKFIAVK